MYRVYLDEYVVVSWSHDIQGELFYWFEVLDEFVTSETVEGVGPTRRVYNLTTKGTFSGKSLASQSGVTNYEMRHFGKTE